MKIEQTSIEIYRDTRIEKRTLPKTVFGHHYGPEGRITHNAYRYQLYRFAECPLPLLDASEKSERRLCFVMLNPSTADASTDDPTIRKCRRFAADWGYQILCVVNLFAWRTASPKKLVKVFEMGIDVTGLGNDLFLSRAVEDSDITIAAWGALPRQLEWRAAEVREFLRKEYPSKVRALGLTKAGHPRHPLYVKKDTKPIQFLVRRK